LIHSIIGELFPESFTHIYIRRDVDQVHDMMDDIAEQQDVAREISDAISNPVAFGQDADEDELEKELEELQQEQLDEELLGIPQHDTTTDELPAVPTSVPAVPSKTRTSNYYLS
jgi:charged multivesicular body protein 4